MAPQLKATDVKISEKRKVINWFLCSLWIGQVVLGLKCNKGNIG